MTTPSPRLPWVRPPPVAPPIDPLVGMALVSVLPVIVAQPFSQFLLLVLPSSLTAVRDVTVANNHTLRQASPRLQPQKSPLPADHSYPPNKQSAGHLTPTWNTSIDDILLATKHQQQGQLSQHTSRQPSPSPTHSPGGRTTLRALGKVDKRPYPMT